MLSFLRGDLASVMSKTKSSSRGFDEVPSFKRLIAFCCSFKGNSSAKMEFTKIPASGSLSRGSRREVFLFNFIDFSSSLITYRSSSSISIYSHSFLDMFLEFSVRYFLILVIDGSVPIKIGSGVSSSGLQFLLSGTSYLKFLFPLLQKKFYLCYLNTFL